VNATLNQTAVLARVAKKIYRASDRVGFLPAIGTQIVSRCAGIVCKKREKYYVETGVVAINLPKLGGDYLPARLAGLWVN